LPSDLEFTGGRFVPGIAGEIAHEQWHCYAFARRNVAGKRGIDVACGEGHRSALMAGVATIVTGIDVDTVVSFETAEHLPRAYQPRMLAEIARSAPPSRRFRCWRGEAPSCRATRPCWSGASSWSIHRRERGAVIAHHLRHPSMTARAISS
jgi:hypothetical protein